MKNNLKIEKNLTKYPYRGLLTQIAKEEGVSPQQIWNSIKIYNNPRLIQILADKIDVIDRNLKLSHKKLR